MQVVVDIAPEDIAPLQAWLADKYTGRRQQSWRDLVHPIVINDDGGSAWLEAVECYYEDQLAEDLGPDAPEGLKPWQELPLETRTQLARELAALPEWVFPELGPIAYRPSAKVSQIIIG